jgi:outer membrane protein TolC
MLEPVAHTLLTRAALCSGLTAVGLVLLSGCAGPVERRSEEDLRRVMEESLRREIAPLDGGSPARTTAAAGASQDLEIQPEYLEEIDRVYNPERYYRDASGETTGALGRLAGEDLLGRPPQAVSIGLQRVVRSAVERNLSVQEASLGPAVGEAVVASAEAAFDWVFYSDFLWQDFDTAQAGPGFIPGVSGETMNSSQTVGSTTGLRRSLVTGGQFSIDTEAVYSDLRQSGFGALPSPNPSASSMITMQLDQPLLRGFGPDVALADVRLARNAERGSIARLKSNLIAVATETEAAYWELLRAQRELLIASKLLERGVQVRDDIKARRVLDAVQAQVADAVATVERRKGDVLRAQRGLRRASDRLKALMNDPEIPVGSELLLVPSDDAIDEPVTLSLLDEIETAVKSRPEIDTALLAIDDASIRQAVARNGTLPGLDLRASATLMGFDGNMGRSYGEIGRGEFIDEFLLGMFFEQPVGNRGAEADFRRSRLERMQSVIAYRRTVQDVVLEVKNALDDVFTNYRLIEQARAGRIAAAEAIRTLLVEKQLTDRGYTVERLNLELSQQEALAAAERSEIQALIDYNTAIARLHAATGTALERNRINFVVPDLNQINDSERASRLP